MRTFSFLTLLCLLLNISLVGAEELTVSRVINFEYRATIPAVEKGEGPVEVFIPLATSNEHQEVLNRTITAPLEGEIKQEDKYGNSFWHAKAEDTKGKEVEILVSYSVKRLLNENKPSSQQTKKEELEDKALFLKANHRVPVSGELLQRIKKDIPGLEGSPQKKARAIYDYVVDTMEYKKVGTGWGNGDTFWACSEKYGNCTDFHALFISLARSENIPARFEMGVPIPEAKSSGKIGGYHCWVSFYLTGFGWVPIDASEAKKNLDRRELFYGTHPADRIGFTIGRDIELGEGHSSGALNYFIYPHIEIAGSAVKKVKTSFTYTTPTAE